MVQIQAKQIDLRYLIDNFGLQRVQNGQFVREWQDNLPKITDLHKQLLDQVREGYFNLLDYPPLLEDVIRMTILNPILFIGGFYLAPFRVRSEESVEIAVEDEGVIIKGKIATLALKERLWVMVIESKRASFSVEEGIAQILVYMLSNPDPSQPSYGMITSGGSFMFLKLVKGTRPQYARSNLFATSNQGDLSRVLSILKRISQLANSE